MKTTKRFSLGLISSLLLAVGLVRAAEKFDPISNESRTGFESSQAVIQTAEPCYGYPDLLGKV